MDLKSKPSMGRVGRALQSTVILAIMACLVLLVTFPGLEPENAKQQSLQLALAGTLTAFLIAVAFIPKARPAAPQPWMRYTSAVVVVLVTVAVATYPLHMYPVTACGDLWSTTIEGYACGPSWEFTGDLLTLALTTPALVLALLQFRSPSSYARNSVYCIAANWLLWVVWALEDMTDWCNKAVPSHEVDKDVNQFLAALGKCLTSIHLVWIAVMVLRRSRRMDKASEIRHMDLCGGISPWWLVAVLAVVATFTQLARYVHIYLYASDMWATMSGLAAVLLLPVWVYFAYLHARAFQAYRQLLTEKDLSGPLLAQVRWAQQVLRMELGAGLVLAILTGAHWALTGIVGLCGVEKYSQAYYWLLHALKRGTGVADAWGLLVLSGLLQARGGGALKPRAPTCLPPAEPEAAWQAKVEELANRGIYLSDLLDFYQTLLEGQAMRGFNVMRSTTSDVAREAVIPLSRGAKDQEGQALASVWNKQQPVLAERMVTHNWGNRFSHLVAAIVADAMGCACYADVLDSLRTVNDVVVMREKLNKTGALRITYWVCVFCVNQHASICAGFGPCPSAEPAWAAWDSKRRNSVTGEVYPLCSCSTRKYFNDEAALTELNKFDDLMRFLASQLPVFVHVTVADEHFEVFKRAWCVAEIVEGSALNIRQRIVVPSSTCLDEHYGTLKNLDIRNCEASRVEDKEQILSRIDDVAGFNEYLGWLIFDVDGIFSGFLDGEARLAMVGRLSLRMKAFWEG
ncbi:unnamed protein product [Effrenium voratum]|nr:unnamed protein product [Effrenium voratum]